MRQELTSSVNLMIILDDKEKNFFPQIYTTLLGVSAIMFKDIHIVIINVLRRCILFELV